MSVRVRTRKRDGATIYSARFTGPRGGDLVRRVVVLPAGASKTAHARARTKTEKYAHDRRTEVESGTWVDLEPEEKTLTLQGLVNRFLAGYRPRSGRIDYYQERSKVWLEHLSGKMPAAAVQPRHVDKLKAARLKTVSESTVRKDLVSLSTMYRWAIARRLVPANPADPGIVKRPAKSRPDPHPLTDGEVVALLDACVGWLEPIVELAIETGADRAELLGLRWGRHVDRQRRLIRLPRAKTGVGRVIPYGSNSAIRLLLARAWRVRCTSGHVFHRAGKAISGEAAKSGLARAYREAEVAKPKPWKSLRATFATRHLARGTDVATVAELMGLTTAHVIDHYAKMAAIHLRSAMANSRKSRTRTGTTFSSADSSAVRRPQTAQK